MIKNLVFDFGKVLVDYDFSYIVDTFFEDKDELKKFKSLIVSDEFIDKCDKEDVPFSELIRQQQEKYPQWKNQLQQFHDRYVDFVLGEVPGMRILLAELKAEGYRLYGITNWCSVVHEVMKRYPEIFSLLDGRIISSEEHLLKPDVAIYHRFLEQYELLADECLFTDDKEANIEGAKAAGIHAILFRNAQQYKEDLNLFLSKQ